jgi:hypothetical protein
MSKSEIKDAFGGHLLKNSNAKAARPLSGSSFMQIVLKSRTTASSQQWGKNIKARMLKITKDMGNRHRVQIKEFTWKKNQLYLNIRLSRKKRYTPFIRALSGAIAIQMSGANKFNALNESFWQGRPWTCILNIIKNSFKTKKMLLSQISSIHLGDSVAPRQRALGP